jgi:hypothetical protein
MLVKHQQSSINQGINVSQMIVIKYNINTIWIISYIFIVPSPPLNLKCINITSTTVTLQWDIPWVFNGLLKSFFITVQDTSESEILVTKKYDVVEETSNYTYLVNIKNVYGIIMKFKVIEFP